MDINIEDLNGLARALRDTVVGFTKAVACQATIAGMNAENQDRESMGSAIAYPEKAYSAVTDTLTAIAADLRDIVI